MPWRARDFVHRLLRRRGSRPQLKREPLDCTMELMNQPIFPTSSFPPSRVDRAFFWANGVIAAVVLGICLLSLVLLPFVGRGDTALAKGERLGWTALTTALFVPTGAGFAVVAFLFRRRSPIRWVAQALPFVVFLALVVLATVAGRHL